ncbi:uncharacterized protein LOC129725625 [Wyeomyia smithii]|uniref:uncharacterized protein LOC129725625 n=1 Tax=Wyeomyia smithii TaxID=174621 RepID=UPI002467BB6B|nr:uncharacterized protein LOC129725625 [Wyeomyia smithii]
MILLSTISCMSVHRVDIRNFNIFDQCHVIFQEANHENDTYNVPVQLSEIFDFAAGGSRLVQEGERVFNAAHLLIVGVEEVYKDGVSIFSTFLQSSYPSSEPHVIKIRTKKSFDQWTFDCTCKAGKGKCKHQMAILYHLLKKPTIPLLTVTDLKQKWGKIPAKTATDMYKAVRLKDLCFTEKSKAATGLEVSLQKSTVEEFFDEEKQPKSSKFQQYVVSQTE